MNVIQNRSFVNAVDWIHETVKYIIQKANESIEQTGLFNIVLTGGDTPGIIYNYLKTQKTDWSCWFFWLSDEREVSSTFRNTNCEMIYQELLNGIQINPEQINFFNQDDGISKAILEYEQKVKSIDLFDLVLLGIGEDGHTASLFPGNEIGIDIDSPDVLAVFNSPKPPSHRITLSANRLSNSTDVLFLARGNNKKNILSQMLPGSNLPANFIRGKNQTSIFYCEE